MKLSKKTVLIGTLLAGTVLATATLAEMGPGGMVGMGHGEGPGPMLLEMFDAIDTDSDGKLSLAELEVHRAAEFTAADTNSDGALDAEELATHMMARFQGKMAERTQAMIDNRDADANGSLSVDEMGQGPGMEHFARIDTDNDGMITKAEAETAIQMRKKHGRGMGMMGSGQGCDEGEGGN